MSLDLTLSNLICDKCGTTEEENFNITHNLIDMAREAKIYNLLWKPEESGISKASQMIEPLSKAIEEMTDDPERFEKHNPTNGWGTYKGFLRNCIMLRELCKLWPDASVDASV